MAKNNPLFKETTQEELDSINRAYGVRPQGNRTASGVTAYTDAGTRGAAYTPKTGIKGGYGVTTPYTPTQTQPAQSQPTQTGEKWWQKIGKYWGQGFSGGNNPLPTTTTVGAYPSNAYVSGIEDYQMANTIDDSYKYIDQTKNKDLYEKEKAAYDQKVADLSANTYSEAERIAGLDLNSAMEEVGAIWDSKYGSTMQWAKLSDEQKVNFTTQYIESAKQYLIDNPKSDEEKKDESGENKDGNGTGTGSTIDTSLTPEQQAVLDKAYAMAKQNALETKQGTISQAYDEYRRATNPYGSVAENLAANGLSQNGGYSKYMGGQRFNAYANAVGGANKAYGDTIGNLNLSKAESTLAYEEANKTNATTEAANAETKKTNALNTLAYYTPEYDSDGNITSDSKAKITAVLKDAGYTDNEIELILGYYKQS